MKAIISFLLAIGKPFSTKNKNGVMVIDPKPFDEAKLESLASSAGLDVIHSPEPTYNAKLNRMMKPSLFVGVVNNETEADLLDTLKGLK